MVCIVHSRTALVDHATQVLTVHGGVVMSRVHVGIPLLWLVGIPLMCVVVCVRACRWVSVLLNLPYRPVTFLVPLSCVCGIPWSCTCKDTMVEAENIEDNRQRRRQADGINNIIKVPLDKRLFESRDGKWDLSCVCSPTRLILNCSFTAWLRVYFLDCICFGYSIVPLV